MATDPALAIDRMSWALAGADPWMVEPDDARILRGGLLEITVGGSARRGIVADNDDALPLPAGEPLAVPGSPIARRRSWTIAAIAASCAFHGCVALFFLTRGPDSALLEGSENAGITILGDATDDQAMSRAMSPIDPAITEVTLISTIEARPVETTDAVAVTQVEKAEIVETLLPEATAVETLEPVEQAAALFEPAAPVAGEAASPAPAEILPEILASETLHSNATDTVVPVAPEQIQAESVEPAKAAEVEATDSVVAAYEPEPQAKPAVKPTPVAKQPAVKKPASKAAKKLGPPSQPRNHEPQGPRLPPAPLDVAPPTPSGARRTAVPAAIRSPRERAARAQRPATPRFPTIPAR